MDCEMGKGAMNKFLHFLGMRWKEATSLSELVLSIDSEEFEWWSGSSFASTLAEESHPTIGVETTGS
jgi:hypothetical protein